LLDALLRFFIFSLFFFSPLPASSIQVDEATRVGERKGERHLAPLFSVFIIFFSKFEISQTGAQAKACTLSAGFLLRDNLPRDSRIVDRLSFRVFSRMLRNNALSR